MTYLDLQIYLSLCRLSGCAPSWEGLRSYGLRMKQARREQQ